MIDNPKLKKTLAREVLLFFSVLVLTGLVWISLLIRNYYYDDQTKSSQDKLIKITEHIDSLPSDKIKALYDGVNSDFVVYYIVNNDKYAIPKKEEQNFLKDYPTAKLLPPFPKGYSLFKPRDPLKILDRDSKLVFDYVESSKFRQLLKDSVYRSKLYSTYSKTYDLGTQLSFEAKVYAGLKFNNEIVKRQQELLHEKQVTQDTLYASKNSIKSNQEVWKIVLWIFIILAIIVYPLRLCFKLLKWSIKTVRQNAT